MNNDLSVSELLAKLNADVQQWDKKRQLAEEALREATARAEELRQTMAGLRRYIPEIDSFNDASCSHSRYRRRILRHEYKKRYQTRSSAGKSTTPKCRYCPATYRWRH